MTRLRAPHTSASAAILLGLVLAGAPAAAQEGAPPYSYSSGYDASLRQAEVVPAQDVLERVYFAFDSADLSPEAQATLDRLAGTIEGNPDIDNVNVIGHADTAGPADYNLNLSMRRAEAVSQYLTSLGVSNQVLDLAWQGESEPLVETGDGVALQENRRVSITIPAAGGFRAASAQ